MNKNHFFILITILSIILLLYNIFIVKNVYYLITPILVLIAVGLIYFNNRNKKNN